MKNPFCLSSSAADKLGIGLFKYSLAPSEKFIAVNSALVKMLGYNTKQELRKEKLGYFFADEKDRENFFKVLIGEERISVFEAIFKNKEGKSFWAAITASLATADDKKTYCEGIIENISSRKKAEERLIKEGEFLQELLDNIPDAIYFKDRDNKIVKVNKFYAQGIGIKQEEIIGKTDFDFFPYEQAAKMSEDDNYVLRTGKPIVGKIERTLLPNGTWNQVVTTKLSLRSREGEVIGTAGITRDITAYANFERERLAMLINALEVLEKALEMRDPYTFSHTRYVARIAEAIGKKINSNENFILGMILAGELHDLGKIIIPLDILNKSGKLTDAEYAIVQEHVKKCYELIQNIDFPFPLAEAIYQHHERLDGSGYPRKLKGDEIILEARILTVSDVLEAVTSRRPYREALGLDKALQELREGANLKYDPHIVETVFELIKENKDGMFWVNS